MCAISVNGTMDPTLRALGIVARGRVMIRRGQVMDGLPLLDAAMVAATADDLDPSWAGNIYCHLMSSCAEIADLRRAGEWTELTARWCETMPGAGPFLGICRVHRAEILCSEGAWERAEQELVHVVEGPGDFDLIVIAEAHYRTGELHRLRGRFADAEAAFRAAHGLGRDPQPGRALLALAQGRGPAAAASLQAALSGATDPLARAPLLPAAAEIATVVHDHALGESAAAELEHLADCYGTLGFQAQAATARGRLALLDGQPGSALRALTRALHAWHRQRAPFEVARTRLLLAQAYDRLGDRDTARLEREVADRELRRLGALIRGGDAAVARGDGLTAREAEVLLMVTTGHSNQQIANELVLSIRTVERHLATVYQKLDLHGPSARAAAVSHALRNGLVVPR